MKNTQPSRLTRCLEWLIVLLEMIFFMSSLSDKPGCSQEVQAYRLYGNTNDHRIIASGNESGVEGSGDVRISILPKTPLGRWSVSLGVAWILFFALSVVLTGFEVFGTELNPALAFALTIVLTCIAVAALVTGVISMIKSKERSDFVFLVSAIGLYSMIGNIISLLGLAK